MLVETDGETVLSSRGALTTGMENSLQSAVRDRVHSNTRVRFPMVRKGFLASPEKPQGIRGQDEFVRVSWDEALELIHQQHKRIREAYGPASILLVPTAGVQTACCIRPRHYYNAIWRWQAVIPGIWGLFDRCSTGDHAVCRGGSEVYQQQTSWPRCWNIAMSWCCGVLIHSIR